MTDIELIIKRLEERAEALEESNAAFEQTVSSIEEAAFRADSYRQVANAQASHNWGYYQHLHKDELDQYWAQTVDDIVYAHGREAHYGHEATYQYYIETPRSMCSAGRKFALQFYGIHADPPDGPGYRVHNVLGSPVIEIAGDGKTAQGIWMAHTFMSQMNSRGQADPSFGLARYGDEFYYENGSWKMWHRRDYVDSMLPCHLLSREPFENSIPHFEEGVKRIAQEGDNIYHPYSCTRREPSIPQPYRSWNPEQSYLQPAVDDSPVKEGDESNG